MRSRAAGLDALPVRFEAAGPHAEAIRNWAESVAGMQPVDAATATLVPPRLLLCDVAGADRAGEWPAALPRILLVDQHDPAAEAAGASACLARGGASVSVIAWPAPLDAVAGAVSSLTSGVPEPTDVDELRVGAAAGGVGATTVALGLGGLLAWGGGPTLVVTHGVVHAPTGRVVAVEDLDGLGLWEVAEPTPGVRGLRVVRTPTPAVAEQRVSAASARFVVRDLGVEEDCDLLVVRRDVAGVEAAARSGAASIAVVDTGVVSLGTLRSAADGRRLVTVPWSMRVARAAASRRLPAGAPGAWLATLGRLLGGQAGGHRVRAVG